MGQHTPHVDSTAIFANAVGNTNEPRPFLQLEATLIAIVRVKICRGNCSRETPIRIGEYELELLRRFVLSNSPPGHVREILSNDSGRKREGRAEGGGGCIVGRGTRGGGIGEEEVVK